MVRHDVQRPAGATVGHVLAVSRADYWSLLQGASVTVTISLVAIAIGVPSGLLLAIVRWRRTPLLDPAVAALVSLLRATPSVTLVLLIYFALPSAGLEMSRFWAAVATLALGTAAYNCEIWRASLLAFPKEQLDAAASVGMTHWRAFRRVVLPQIVRGALPALVNEVTLLIKVTPAVAVIGLVETTRAAVRVGAATYAPIPPFLCALVIYVCIIGSLLMVQRRVERRLATAA